MTELERLDGLFVGQLDEEEFELFLNAIENGRARKVYSGLSGFLGLPRVKVTQP